MVYCTLSMKMLSAIVRHDGTSQRQLEQHGGTVKVVFGVPAIMAFPRRRWLCHYTEFWFMHGEIVRLASMM